MTTEHSHREILEMLQASTKPPIIATDGSIRPYKAQGTFVLTDQDGTPWLRCRGPVSGTLINSFRSKAHALLSVLCIWICWRIILWLLFLPSRFVYIPTAKATSRGSSRIDIGCDRNFQMKHSAQAGICIKQSTTEN
jgi:hypothetical protein